MKFVLRPVVSTFHIYGQMVPSAGPYGDKACYCSFKNKLFKFSSNVNKKLLNPIK